jgi:predicted DNA-binding protein with PD1-like motif
LKFTDSILFLIQMASNLYAFRLTPATDLKLALQAIINEHQIKAGWIITCVGSLSRYNIRFANGQAGTTNEGFFEIVSLVGTLSRDGMHLHISLSNETGSTIGGHLLEGCIIYTTAEIILGTTDEFIFSRESDAGTGFKELKIV